MKTNLKQRCPCWFCDPDFRKRLAKVIRNLPKRRVA